MRCRLSFALLWASFLSLITFTWSSSLCLCVGHSKYVVSFNTLVVATVSWDGVTKIQSALFYVHSIIEAGGVLSRLVILGLLMLSTLFHKSSSGIINVTRVLNTVELVDSWGCNRLNWIDSYRTIWIFKPYSLISAVFFVNSNLLCNSFMVVMRVINILRLEAGCELLVSWLIVTPCDVVRGRSEWGLAISLSENVLRFNSWNVASVACRKMVMIRILSINLPGMCLRAS